ncbi:MAG TPA: NADH-quinone oxidoreductase subunit C [Geobacterales bacterium]|nr:NADH-quinone oxidoreductase subunit C [Geobacterales bacterium]
MSEQLNKLKEILPYAEIYKIYKNKYYAKIPKDKWHDAARRLKEAGYVLLSAVTAVDRLNSMEVMFICRRLEANGLVIVGTLIDRNDPRIPSLVSVWEGAHFHERETFDLMGVYFEGNPDLRRILLPPHWVGHPLRKDYKW